ncbi:uncharacterized protein [Watersipora subatra]|uniref:uncharacterized protein isoform X2 n=1 Tax=Watersipora subatra TaxID=2589382 RepID=UPI00355B4B08
MAYSSLSSNAILAVVILGVLVTFSTVVPAEQQGLTLERTKRFFIDGYGNRCMFEILCWQNRMCNEEAGEMCLVWYCGTHCAVPKDPDNLPRKTTRRKKTKEIRQKE